MNSPQATPQNTPSGAEQVAKWAGGARVVKIFNTTGFNNTANPKYGSETLTPVTILPPKRQRHSWPPTSA